MDGVATLNIKALNIYGIKFKKNEINEKLDTPLSNLYTYKKERKKEKTSL